MTDATKNKASFIAYNNNTLLQQNNFMSTKRTLSEHINPKKNKPNITNVYITLHSESLFPHLQGAQYAPLLFPSIFKYVLRKGMHYNPVRQNNPYLS